MRTFRGWRQVLYFWNMWVGKCQENNAGKVNHRGLECHAEKFECFPVGNGTTARVLHVCFGEMCFRKII